MPYSYSIPKADSAKTSNLRQSLSKAKLQLLLRERNLPVYGNKTVLRQRLQEFGQNPDEWEWYVCACTQLLGQECAAKGVFRCPACYSLPAESSAVRSPQKLSGAARRAAEIFEPKDPSSQAYEPFLTTDHRADHQVEMQQQAVRVTMHVSHTVGMPIKLNYISLFR